jgi:AcrR family transcriptional regulator
MPKASAQRPAKNRRRLAPSIRRELIQDAATRIFAERGYEAATMQGIAREAGVVASVLYDHYPSKRELYIGLIEEHGQKLMERTIRAPEGMGPRVELQRQIDDFLRTLETDPFVWRMLFRDPPADPITASAHERVQEGATEAIARVLDTSVVRSKSSGGSLTPPQAIMVAEMVKASLIGLAAWWWDHRETSREDLGITATALLWNGLSRIGRPV